MTYPARVVTRVTQVPPSRGGEGWLWTHVRCRLRPGGIRRTFVSSRKTVRDIFQPFDGSRRSVRVSRKPFAIARWELVRRQPDPAR